jgi:hypothetical protein
MANPRLHENKFKRALVVPFRGVVRKLSPVNYVKYQYKYITHHPLDLKNPKRYTEKLQFLRLFVDPYDYETIQCAGRVTVRDYVKKAGYGDTLIPCLGIYDHFEDIDFDTLPDRFVMKCSHASGYNLIVKDKNHLDLFKANKKFDHCLRPTMEPKPLSGIIQASNLKSSSNNISETRSTSRPNIRSMSLMAWPNPLCGHGPRRRYSLHQHVHRLDSL